MEIRDIYFGMGGSQFRETLQPSDRILIMLHTIVAILILAAHGIFPPNAQSDENHPVVHGVEANVKELHLVYLFEDSPTQFIFRIGDAGFRTVEILKRHIETWPAGTELRWAPGCERFGNEPLLSSERDLESFRQFLQQRGIKFTLVPSG